jgi:cytochrome c-type biogenesis protein CcmH
VLRTIAAERPSDPQAFDFLGRAELAAGDPFAAERAFGRAIRLGDKGPELYASLGQARVMQADGKMTPEAKAAFQQALKLDPNNVTAGYAIGRAQLEAGDSKAAAATWRALAGHLPDADPRRRVLLAEAAQATAPHGPPALSGPETAAGVAIRQAAPAEQAAFIRGMVERLAARLQAQPDDVDGWARLVRAYGVIGDKAAQARALATARKQFAGRPDALAKVEAEARATGAG